MIAPDARRDHRITRTGLCTIELCLQNGHPPHAFIELHFAAGDIDVGFSRHSAGRPALSTRAPTTRVRCAFWSRIRKPDAAGYLLTGKNYFMSGDYKKAVEFFEKALAIAPGNSEYELWLGRAWGRRAEKLWRLGYLMAAPHVHPKHASVLLVLTGSIRTTREGEERSVYVLPERSGFCRWWNG